MNKKLTVLKDGLNMKSNERKWRKQCRIQNSRHIQIHTLIYV